MSEWQPIETAPRDGSRIIGWTLDDGLDVHPIEIVWWEPGFQSWHWKRHPTVDGAFIKVDEVIPGYWQCDRMSPVRVSYWMPLPAAPITTEDRELIEAGGGGMK